MPWSARLHDNCVDSTGGLAQEAGGGWGTDLPSLETFSQCRRRRVWKRWIYNDALARCTHWSELESTWVGCNSPHDFKEGEFQAIRALGAYAEIGKDKEPGVLAPVLMILEVIETGDDGAGGVPCLAVLEEVEFLVRVWGGEGGEHEVIRVLQEGRGLLVCGVRGDLVAGVGVGDSELDDGRRVDGSSVRCSGCIRMGLDRGE